MSRKRWKAYGKENTTIEWDDGGKIGNKIKLILTLSKQNITHNIPILG